MCIRDSPFPMLAALLSFLRKLHTVIDILPARISQKDGSLIGLACFRGIELLHIHFAGFKERGGNLRGKSGLASVSYTHLNILFSIATFIDFFC